MEMGDKRAEVLGYFQESLILQWVSVIGAEIITSLYNPNMNQNVTLLVIVLSPREYVP